MIVVLSHKKSHSVTTVWFSVYEKWNWVTKLQICSDWKVTMRTWSACAWSSQNCNLNEVEVMLGQDCYNIYHILEFRKSDDKTAPWAVKSKTGWALSCLLSAKQEASLASTATWIEENRSASQLTKWWDIESYAPNCDVTAQSNDEPISVETLEQTTRLISERYLIGILRQEDIATSPKKLYSSSGQQKSIERHLTKNLTLKKRYHQTPDT